MLEFHGDPEYNYYDIYNILGEYLGTIDHEPGAYYYRPPKHYDVIYQNELEAIVSKLKELNSRSGELPK